MGMENKTTHSAIAQAESAATSETSTITASAKSKGSVLLQTATAEATNQDGSKSTSIKILFDSGSQRSYVTENLKTRLGLKSTKTDTLHLNTFGDDNYRKQKCEVLSLPLRDINNDEIAAITVLSSPVICSPLNMTVEVSKYPHLQGLQLVDSSKSHKSIDVLIGSDYYWDFVTGDTVCGEFGPTAINSKFGWLVSGPTAKCVTNDDITVSNLIISGNCSNMHETSQDPLVDTLKQFWETETIGIEHSVPKELPSVSPVPRNDIERNGQIYKVGLPWKEDFMASSDNYGMYASGLRSLHYKLRKEPELLSEYDRIIQEQQKAGIIEKVSRDNDGKESRNIKGVRYSPRCLPVTLKSDNARTFKNAATQVATINRSSDVQSYLANQGVIWSFIVEKAPWWGGFWERMVRTVKRALRKTIGRNSLTFEQLNTILIEIEAVVNERPLTYVQDDSCGISYALSPSHLINC